jgi:membrane glycosyltransferase
MPSRWRLHLLLSGVGAATLLATSAFASALVRDGLTGLEIVLLASFAILFAWLTFWCLLTAIGFVAICRTRRVPLQPTSRAPSLPACAVLIPVHNEDAERVFTRVHAMMESIEQTGHARSFELFVLSDTTDPDIWLREELSWAELRRSHPGAPHLYYRRRAVKFRRKSGNIADFCLRWGNRYRYMIVLDADSVMLGETMIELVRRMERAPRVGILQAATLPALRHSLYARREQFAASLYGPPLFAGISVCFQGGANFWGHNAIVRVGAFAAHCGLPVLPGRPPLGGPILSHDFVEAGLMVRAGYEVRLAWDLASGSYEQPPTSLASAVARDRRWCQGNLQHLRLLFARGFALPTRLHFLAGGLFYLSSLFWAAFLCAFAAEDIRHQLSRRALDALSPVDRGFGVVLAVVLLLLLAAKAFGITLVLIDRRASAGYGNRLCLLASAALETAIGVMIAPVMMLHHLLALFSIALGLSTDWQGSSREESRAPWRDAWRAHRFVSTAGALLGVLLLWQLPALALRLSPVWVSLLLAVPIEAALASSSLGTKLRARGVLSTPAETLPPPILSRIAAALSSAQAVHSTFSERFRRLVQDPWLNAIHVALLHAEGEPPRPRGMIQRIAARSAARGTPAISRKERLALLSDAWAMKALHLAHLRRDALQVAPRMHQTG